MHQKYAVIDIETTGGMSRRDKITEIAIIVFDGDKIIDEYQSLVNPERSIPPQITRITGITNEMVDDAPRFFEIAKDVIEKTESCIFVAHNVRFDYNFIAQEFASLGYTFTRRKLCTVRLSRKAFPGLKSYSLGNLIKHFGIKVKDRHRAYDDAYAATELLRMALMSQDTRKAIKGFVSEAVKLSGLPTALNPDDVSRLPMSCGVYYFRDKEGDILYIGKSKNIYKRVKQHFSGKTSKTDTLLKSVAHIDYELTGSELISLLLESREIKKHQPPVNKIQKQNAFPFVLVDSRDKSGYQQYLVRQANGNEYGLAYYASRKSALNHIERLSEHFQLCLKINGLNKGAKHSCFNYGIGKCLGACIGEEPPFEYNQRFEESLDSARRLFEDNLLILDSGRTPKEQSLVLVEDGHYRGFAYIDEDKAISDPEELKDEIVPDAFNPEADMILRSYIHSVAQLKLITF